MTGSLLRDELAPRIVPVLLANLTASYPYHDAHLARGGEPPHDPIAAHPSFGNAFDWHSSVHSHWTALHVLEYLAAQTTAPAATAGIDRLRATVEEHLDDDSIAAERAYLKRRPSYERPYGWAWLLALAAHARRPALNAFASDVAACAIAWLAVLPEPIRHGVHSNSAFALGLMLDAARALQLEELERAIVARAHLWFDEDRHWPESWERSGSDFLSPGLAEADLMRRLQPPSSFARWWHDFLPALDDRSRIVTPVDVPTVSDGQIVHLHGLNLSRAAMLARIGTALGDGSFRERSERLYRASVERASGDDYLATHWLPTFAWDAACAIDAMALP